MRWLIKVVSGSWPHCVPHSQRDPLTGQQAQDSLPNSSDSRYTKEVPWGGSQVPQEGRFIFKPLCCLHLQTDGPPLSQIEAVESQLLLSFFTHLIT